MDHANARFLTEVDLTLAGLAFASGSADVFAFLKFHEVFTSAMTGNTALLGMAIGQGHLLAAQRSLAALLGYCAGSIAGTVIADLSATASRAARLRRLIGIEIAGLAFVLVVWALAPEPVYGPALYAMILIGAIAMGMQSIAAREVNLPGINTVVVTNTLTLVMSAVGAAIRLSARTRRLNLHAFDPITLRQAGMLAVYISGAALSGVLAVALPVLIAVPALLAVIWAFIIAGRVGTARPRPA